MSVSPLVLHGPSEICAVESIQSYFTSRTSKTVAAQPQNTNYLPVRLFTETQNHSLTVLFTFNQFNINITTIQSLLTDLINILCCCIRAADRYLL